jgi:hypothetical protein
MTLNSFHFDFHGDITNKSITAMNNNTISAILFQNLAILTLNNIDFA